MTKQGKVEELFLKIDKKFKHLRNTRHYFYISRECLRLFEQCPEIPSGTEPPFLGPFNSAFYYFVKTSRMEEAQKVFLSGFRSMKPLQLVEFYWPKFEKPKKPDDAYVFRAYLDQVLSFLAQIGYEQEVLKMGGSSVGNVRLRKLLEESWPKLLKRFMTGTRRSEYLELFRNLEDINKRYPTQEIKKIKDSKKTVNFRRWLLKRQMLGIYSIILVALKRPAIFNEAIYPDALENFKKLAADTFENYAFLICYSTWWYIFTAKETLKKVVEPGIKPLWHGEVVENLISQINHVKDRYSDVHAFFKATMDMDLFASYPKKLEEYFKNNNDLLRDLTAAELIDTLENEVLNLDDLKDPEILKRKRTEHPDRDTDDQFYPLQQIRDDIAAKISDSPKFLEICRNKFNPHRLRLLAVSLDNQYSTEAAYFFKTPSIKLDEKKHIETELCMLKKWGSTGGLFERGRYINASFGGGYFLFHNGFGLAIDVGPDFLRHLTQHTDFDLMDINGVVCTHPHHDHVGEFKRILLGIREYNRTVGFKRLYYLFPDPDDQEMMHLEKYREDFCINVFHSVHSETAGKGEKVYYFPDNQWGRKHGIRVQPIKVKHNIYIDSRYHSLNKSKTKLEKKLKELKKGKELRKTKKILKKIREEMTKIQAEYETSCGEELGTRGERWWSYALLVSPLMEEQINKDGKTESIGKPLTTILFSGDAEYQKGLFENIDPRFKPELVVLNISSARMGDIIAGELKQNHLGYSGVLNLLSRLREKYKVAAVSEFFESQSQVDSRLLVTNSLKQDLVDSKNPPPKILACEPGIRFRWPEKDQLEVFCSNLCNEDNNGFIDPHNKIFYQATRSPYARKEPILMVCSACEKDKQEVYGIG